MSSTSSQEITESSPILASTVEDHNEIVEEPCEWFGTKEEPALERQDENLLKLKKTEMGTNSTSGTNERTVGDLLSGTPFNLLSCVGGILAKFCVCFKDEERGSESQETMPKNEEDVVSSREGSSSSNGEAITELENQEGVEERDPKDEGCLNVPENQGGSSEIGTKNPEELSVRRDTRISNESELQDPEGVSEVETKVQEDVSVRRDTGSSTNETRRRGLQNQQESVNERENKVRKDVAPSPSSSHRKWSDFNACEESDMMHLTSHEGEIPSNDCLSVKRTLDSNDLEEYTMSSGNEPMINQENTMSSGNQPMVDHNHETDRFAYGNRSSSTNDEQRREDARPQQRYRMSSGRNWHQSGTSDTFRRDSKFRSRRDSFKRFHQQAPQRIPPFERGSHTPLFLRHPPQPLSSPGLPVQQNVHYSQRYASAAHFDPMVPQVSTMQDMHLPSIALARQAQPYFPSNTYPEALMSQYSMQNIGQHGNVQNSQAYNNYQCQYYYYQQQPLMWQQQQQMMQQQPRQQQFLQQQYQQQMLQMQILQQQQLEQQQLPNLRQEQQQQLQQQEQGQQLQLLQQQQSTQQHQLQLQQPQHLLQQQSYELPQQQFITSHMLEFKQEASEGHEDENESAEGHQSSAAATRNPDSPFPDPNQLPPESR